MSKKKEVIIEYIGSLEEAEFGIAGKWRKGEKRVVKREIADMLIRKGVFKEVKENASGDRE